MFGGCGEGTVWALEEAKETQASGPPPQTPVEGLIRTLTPTQSLCNKRWVW